MLRVVVAHRPPFVFVANNTGTPFFYGLLIDLLNKILATSNGTLSYNIYVSPTNAGGSLGPSGWSGIVGELAYGRADVALFPLTRTATRLTAIDCTYSYLDHGIGLAVLDVDKGPGPLSVLAPFEMRLWVTLLFTIIAVALLFWGLESWGKWLRDKHITAFKDAGAITAKEAARAKRKDDRSTVLISFMAAAGAPERPERSNSGVQVLYVVYCFFCLIVLSAYTANLTSFLSVQKSSVQFNGLQDLVDRGAQLAVIPNGTNAAYFTSSYDPLALQLKGRLRFCDTDTCMRLLRAGQVAAFASDQPQLTYLAAQQPCDLAVLAKTFGPGNLVFGLQKNSTLLPLFNAAIQRFAEDGTLTALRRAWFEGLSQCESPDAALGNSKLGVAQMLGAFVLLVAGVVVAFSIGTVENLKWCLARAYQRTYAERMSQDGMDDGRRALPHGPSSLGGKWRNASARLLGMMYGSLEPTHATGTPTAAGGRAAAAAAAGASGVPAGGSAASYACGAEPCGPELPAAASDGGGAAAAAAAKGFGAVRGPDGADLMAAALRGSDLTLASVMTSFVPSRMPTESNIWPPPPPLPPPSTPATALAAAFGPFGTAAPGGVASGDFSPPPLLASEAAAGGDASALPGVQLLPPLPPLMWAHASERAAGALGPEASSGMETIGGLASSTGGAAPAVLQVVVLGAESEAPLQSQVRGGTLALEQQNRQPQQAHLTPQLEARTDVSEFSCD